MITLPGLIDTDAVVQTADAAEAENWQQTSAAALAGGFTGVIAAADGLSRVADSASLAQSLHVAAETALCDYGQLVLATGENARDVDGFARDAAGLSLSFGEEGDPNLIGNMHAVTSLFSKWQGDAPVCVSGGAEQIGAAIFTANMRRKAVHVRNVTRREQVEMIREAKASGLAVTCDVAVHTLFLSQKHLETAPTAVSAMFGALGTEDDRRAIWEFIEGIDCFTSGHMDSRAGAGYPALETALPLLLYAVQGGFLSLEDIVQRCSVNPKRIFGLSQQPDTFVAVDEMALRKIDPAAFHSDAKFSPYQNMELPSVIRRVTLRGQTVFEDGAILAQPGTGLPLRGTAEGGDQ